MRVPGCAMPQAKPTCRRRTSDSSTCRRASMRVASMMTPPTKSPSMAVKANAAPTRRVRKRGVGVALRPPHHVRIAARVHQADDALRDVVLGQGRESTTVGHRRADITLEADAADAVGQRAERGRRTDELQISAPRTARQFEIFEAGAIHVHAQRRSLLPRIAERVVPRRQVSGALRRDHDRGEASSRGAQNPQSGPRADATEPSCVGTWREFVNRR